MPNAKQRDRDNLDADQLWKHYSSLTPEEQQQVIDFLAQLRAQQTVKAQQESQQQIDWSKEPFVGMWRDRDDMTDGARWIRDLRDREWSRHRH